MNNKLEIPVCEHCGLPLGHPTGVCGWCELERDEHPEISIEAAECLSEEDDDDN